MSAARKSGLNRHPASEWRAKAYAAINICFKQIHPELTGDDLREERLAWVGYYLGLAGDLESLTVLGDEQLGMVAGEMKRLVGSRQAAVGGVTTASGSDRIPAADNVIQGDFDRDSGTPNSQDSQDSATSFAASPEQVYTLEKLLAHLGWPAADMAAFLRKRYRCTSFVMLRFKQATTATHILLNIAAHQDLKKRTPGKPIGRQAIAKYVPLLKEQLGIDR